MFISYKEYSFSPMKIIFFLFLESTMFYILNTCSSGFINESNGAIHCKMLAPRSGAVHELSIDRATLTHRCVGELEA